MIDTLSTWRQLLKEKDASGLQNLLNDDVIFYSPVVHTPVSGKKVVLLYLSAAFQVFANDSFRYVRELNSVNDAVLEFEVEIDDILVNGIDMFKWNDNGLIVEFKVFVRPLKAINLIHEKMVEIIGQNNLDLMTLDTRIKR